MSKAIIFDLDGMLVHGERFSKRLENEFGISTETTGGFFKTDFQDCLIGRADLKEVLPKYFPEWGWKGDLNELLNFWFNERANKIDERFRPIINDLRTRGIYCCLATNNEMYRSQNLINERELGKWFDSTIASYEVGCKKPEIDFFQSILNKTGIAKETTQFWDDDTENINGAIKFGLDSRSYVDFNQFLSELERV